MLGQQRRVGASADWGRLRFTMDDVSAKAVREAFTRLYGDGLAYRSEALINWCPGCRTSVSDLEVIATPETGTLWTIRYHLIDEATGEPDPDTTISIATTRPETLLGDTAVAVHPDDERYRALVGRRVRIPFVERDVAIIADPAVERGVRHGRGQDHPGPRPGRLRDGQTSRPRLDRHLRRPRPGQRARRAVRRPGPLRRARPHRRGARGRGRPRGIGGARDGHRALPAQRRRDRTADQDPVVRADATARGRRAGGYPRRQDSNPARAVREDLGELAHRHPRLEREPPAVVGPPDPRLVLPGRARDREPTRGRPGCL